MAVCSGERVTPGWPNGSSDAYGSAGDGVGDAESDGRSAGVSAGLGPASERRWRPGGVATG